MRFDQKGKVLVGGRFNRLDSLDRSLIARLEKHVLPSGGTIEFSKAVYSVVENNGLATIEVKRTGDLSESVSVQFFAANGTATASVDAPCVAGIAAIRHGESPSR